MTTGAGGARGAAVHVASIALAEPLSPLTPALCPVGSLPDGDARGGLERREHRGRIGVQQLVVDRADGALGVEERREHDGGFPHAPGA